MISNHRSLWSLPWVVALVALAVPMVGSGFIGWPFVVGWIVLIAMAPASKRASTARTTTIRR